MSEINAQDFNNVKRILGGEFLNFLRQLLEGAETLRQLIRSDDAAGKMEDIRMHAHNLKSVGRQSGLETLGGFAARIEKIAIGQMRGEGEFNPEEWAGVCDEYEDILTRTMAELHDITGGEV